jgi:hypothetical protein
MRKGAFAVALVVHIVVLVFLWRYAPQQRMFETSSAMTAAILDEAHVKVTDETVLRRPHLFHDITVKLPEFPLFVSPNGLTEGVSPSSTAITDFSTAAHEAAERITSRAASPSLRSLDRPTAGTPETKREASIFGSPQHTANSTEHFDDGSDRYYVSGNCFYDFDRQSAPPSDLMAGPKLKVPTCKAPAGNGNHEVFKDLTPEALKKLPGGSPP